MRDDGRDSGLFELGHAAQVGAAGGVGAEEAANDEQPEVAGVDEDDAGETGDQHLGDGPSSGGHGPTGEHDDDGKEEAAGEAGAEDDADLGIGDADVGEVDDGEDGHHPSGGVSGEASGVEEVRVEGGPAGGGWH